jgi:hypothetical protein
VQTFLPSKDFGISAKLLDSKRLNKQILECYQILKVLSGFSESGAWRNHPAVLMWKGSENILFTYAMAMIREADSRGIKTDKNKSNINLLRAVAGKTWGMGIPSWYKSPIILKRIVTTHRANLYLKDPEYYYDFRSAVDDPYNVPCCETCKYFWVTHESRKVKA